MDRTDLVLAVLSTSKGAPWTPVQVQKMFFILDRRIPARISGPHFNFQPYDYGPFDATVYQEIEGLKDQGLAEIDCADPFSMRQYRLNGTGQNRGQQVLDMLPESTREYIERVSIFVRTKTFAALVTAIYDAFPDMKVNSVFRTAST